MRIQEEHTGVRQRWVFILRMASSALEWQTERGEKVNTVGEILGPKRVQMARSFHEPRPDSWALASFVALKGAL